MLQAAIVIFLVGSVLCGLAQNIPQLALFRGIQGVGGGGLMAMAFAIIGDVVSPRQRGRYTGYLGAVFAYAQEHQPEIQAELAVLNRSGQRFDDDLLRETCRLNDPEALARSHRVYLTLARIGTGHEYPGVNWVKGWYQRNLTIFVNLTRIATAPDDRILVIYGAGHIPLLTQFIRESGVIDLEPAERYLREENADI